MTSIYTNQTALPLDSGNAPAVLVRARQLTESAIRDAVRTLHPSLAAMSEYHFGWRDASGTAIASEGSGKGVGLALSLLSAEACGAPASVGVPGAVALELLHVFTHIHDDIMDGDSRRRHRESLWKAFGVGPAILTGDALLVLALDVLAQQPKAGEAAVRALLDACRDLATGQELDLEFERLPLEGRGQSSLADYWAMVEGKTGALYECALSIGAILAEAPGPTVRLLSEAGKNLGVVAQIVDDVNGVWGDPA